MIRKNKYKNMLFQIYKRKQHLYLMKVKLSRNLTVLLTNTKSDKEQEQEKLFLYKGKTESALHIILKLLAYLYFWPSRKKLIIEPNLKFHKYKPDLISYRDPELPTSTEREIDVWVECKKVHIKKIMKLGRFFPHCDVYWFHKKSYFDSLEVKFNSRKWKNLPPNTNLIGVMLEPDDWNSFENSVLQGQSKYFFKVVCSDEREIRINDNPEIISVKYHKFLSYK